MLWPGHSNFKLSPKHKYNFGWLLNDEDAHHMDSILNLELDSNLAQTQADVIVKNQCLISKFDSPC